MPYDYRCKNLKKILANQTNNILKSYPLWLNGVYARNSKVVQYKNIYIIHTHTHTHTYIYVIHHINRTKEKFTLWSISIDSEETIDKSRCPFIISTLNKLGKEPTANIMMKGGWFPFSLRSRQRYQFPLLLYKIVLGIVAKGTKQEKEIKDVLLERRK